MRLPEHKGKGTGEEQAVFQPDVENRKEQRSDVVCIRTSGRRCDRSMRNKCLFALGVVFAMSLTSIVAFAFSFTGEPDVKNDQQQIVVVNPATESEETTSEQTVSAETEDTTATLQSAGSSLSGSMDWDAEDAYMLAKIAMAEAESEDTEGKALVMLVVLNRVWSDEFPDTIAGVIFQDGQFSPISNGRYDEVKPDADCYRALQLIQIDGWDESRGATYFESKSESGIHWLEQLR